MNFLIVNQPLGNRGDEAAHKALIRELNKRFENVHITILNVDQNPDTIRQFKIDNSNNEYINIVGYNRLFKYFVKPVIFFKIYFFWLLHPRTRQILGYIKKADLVICAPGGICMGGFMNWHHLMFLYMAKFLHKHILYFGRSIGPFPCDTFEKRIFANRSIELLRSFDYVSLRDSQSQLIANELGINYTSTTDAAFLDDSKIELPNTIKTQLTGKKYIVFVPNYLKWHYAYKTLDDETIFDFYKNIMNIVGKYTDSYIVLLPQTFNNPTGNDVDFFRELKTQMNDDRIIVIDDIYSSDVQQSVIRGAKFVIGARYHSIIFAINQQIPFLALSYEHKMDGILSLLKKTDTIVNILNVFTDTRKMDEVLKQIETIVECKVIDRSMCPNLCKTAQGFAKSQFDDLEYFIRKTLNI